MPNSDRFSMEVPRDEAHARYLQLPGVVRGRLEETGLHMREDTRDQNGRVIVEYTLPANWSKQPAADVGLIFEALTYAAEVINNKLTLARLEEDSLLANLKNVAARVRRAQTGTADDRLDATLLHADYIQADIAYREAEGFRRCLEAISDTCGRNLRAVSRHIELRKEETGAGSRSNNLGRTFR